MPIELTKEQTYDIKSFLAFVLRHKPHFYRIKLDNDGFADIDAVLSAVKKNKKLEIDKDQLIDIMKRFSGGIFLISENKVKAKGGHTVTYNMQVPTEFVEVKDVPSMLYCLIDKSNVGKILSEGGISFSNSKIFLFKEEPKPVEGKSVIGIHAKKALADKTKFYQKDGEFFAHHIASKFVSMHV